MWTSLWEAIRLEADFWFGDCRQQRGWKQQALPCASSLEQSGWEPQALPEAWCPCGRRESKPKGWCPCCGRTDWTKSEASHDSFLLQAVNQPACVSPESWHTLTLSGFYHPEFNQDYIKSDTIWIDGEPSFWSRDGSMLLYHKWGDHSEAFSRFVLESRGGQQLGTCFNSGLSLGEEPFWLEIESRGGNQPASSAKLCGSFRAQKRLLETIPGGKEVLGNLRLAFEPDHLELRVCEALARLPGDDGAFWAKLKMSSNPLDLHFAGLCSEAHNRVQAEQAEQARIKVRINMERAKAEQARINMERARAAWIIIERAKDEEARIHMERAKKRLEAERREAAAAERFADVAAAELIAEEEMEEARSRKKAAKKAAKTAKAKSKSTKAPPAQPSMSDSEKEAVQTEPEASKAVQFDISPEVLTLRHNFPMFDDDVLGEHLMQAAYDLGEAVLSLSKLQAEPGVEIEPVDIPCKPASCLKITRTCCRLL